MKELIKLLEQGEEIAEALKIGLAFKHIQKNHVTKFRDNHGKDAFYGPYDLLDYYTENLEVKDED